MGCGCSQPEIRDRRGGRDVGLTVIFMHLPRDLFSSWPVCEVLQNCGMWGLSPISWPWATSECHFLPFVTTEAHDALISFYFGICVVYMPGCVCSHVRVWRPEEHVRCPFLTPLRQGLSLELAWQSARASNLPGATPPSQGSRHARIHTGLCMTVLESEFRSSCFLSKLSHP